MQTWWMLKFARWDDDDDAISYNPLRMLKSDIP